MSSSVKEDEGITFADCAPVLVVTEESLANVSARLPDDESMDVTKLRPNIVLRKAPGAFDEDYWAELDTAQTKISLTHKCARCQSLNVDYVTGRFANGESGMILKKLMQDRRVDAGTKYSPIFGRYGFPDRGKGPGILRVGDSISITKRNEQRTTFGENLPNELDEETLIS